MNGLSAGAFVGEGLGAGPRAASASGSSSQALARAMQQAGIARPAGSAAHHIVAGNAPAAARARAALQEFGIGINDAANGVFLRANQAAPNVGGAIHSGIHTNAYYRAVNRALIHAQTREQAIDTLNHIRGQLLSGGFP